MAQEHPKTKAAPAGGRLYLHTLRVVPTVAEYGALKVNIDFGGTDRQSFAINITKSGYANDGERYRSFVVPRVRKRGV